MPIHQVDGAKLYYESFGSGPLLVMIIGAHGTGSVFYETAKHLAKSFTVICYDRRGYSKSHLEGDQDYPNRLKTDADDAFSLIKSLSSEPALVYGSSSGALVATVLLTRHPESVSAVVSHEAPAFSVLPEEHQPQAHAGTKHIYDLYREKGVPAAMNVFKELFLLDADKKHIVEAIDTSRSDEIRANTIYWFEREMLYYTAEPIDMEIVVKEGKKYIAAAGELTGDTGVIAPSVIFAKATGKELVRLPGGHMGYATCPEEFAGGLTKVLKGIA